MNIDPKFKALVMYICSRRSDAPETLGAVKLNKILWLSDLSSFYERGVAITESRYNKREHGPVPARIGPTIRELESEGALVVRNADHFGRQKKVFVVRLYRDGNFLADEERSIVDRVIDHVCDEHTAKTVSEATHDHIWKAAEEGEELPLYTVFAKPGRITDAERSWAQFKLESETA